MGQQRKRRDFDLSEAIRETTLINFPDARDRKAARRVGRLLYEASLRKLEDGGVNDESVTHAELRAAAGDLRFLEWFLDNAGKALEYAQLEEDEIALAVFAGEMAVKVDLLAEEIEERLRGGRRRRRSAPGMAGVLPPPPGGEGEGQPGATATCE